MSSNANYIAITLGLLFGAIIAIVILAFGAASITTDTAYCDINDLAIDFINRQNNLNIDVAIVNYTISFPCIANYTQIVKECIISPV